MKCQKKMIWLSTNQVNGRSSEKASTKFVDHFQKQSQERCALDFGRWQERLPLLPEFGFDPLTAKVQL
jgi:hypothetical protein